MKNFTSKQFVLPTVMLFAITIVAYGLSYHGEGKYWNYYVLLADALWQGRMYLTQNPPWLNELIPVNGVYYVPYPPMPSIVLMPFVLLFGTSLSQPFVSILLGAVNVSLCYLVCLRFFQNKIKATWLAILFGFGTIAWYHAEVGSVWYFAHTVALFFFWLALLEVATKKRLFFIGLLISAAFLARLPVLFAAVFPIIYLHDQFFKKSYPKIRWLPNVKNFFVYGLGVASGVVVYCIYNYARFGSFELPYNLIPGVLDEPWYKYGVENYRYIPGHLQEVLLGLPRFVNSWPYVVPNVWGMSIFFTTPAFLLIFFTSFKKRLVSAAALSAICIALVSLMHGSSGFTQFGFRFSLDYTPLLILLVGTAIAKSFTWHAKTLFVLSILINAWGVVLMSFLNIWSF